MRTLIKNTKITNGGTGSHGERNQVQGMSMSKVVSNKVNRWHEVQATQRTFVLWLFAGTVKDYKDLGISTASW